MWGGDKEEDSLVSGVTLPALSPSSSLDLGRRVGSGGHFTFPGWTPFISKMRKSVTDKMSARCFPGSECPLTLYFTS